MSYVFVSMNMNRNFIYMFTRYSEQILYVCLIIDKKRYWSSLLLDSMYDIILFIREFKIFEFEMMIKEPCVLYGKYVLDYSKMNVCLMME